MVVIMKVPVIWVVLLCNLVCWYQRLSNRLCNGNALDVSVVGAWFESGPTYWVS
jgi:hypothetical protein